MLVSCSNKYVFLILLFHLLEKGHSFPSNFLWVWRGLSYLGKGPEETKLVKVRKITNKAKSTTY